jgi:hypothetical protein
MEERKAMEGVGGVNGMPAVPRQRDVAEREFNRIMSGAARLQQVMGVHLVTAGTSTDPVKQAEAMNRAIELAESQLVAFRRARDVLEVASPGFSLPAAPASRFELKPTVRQVDKVAPRSF